MAIWRVAAIALGLPVAVFVTYTALRAISESWNNDAFPEALAIKLEQLPVIFPIHMVTGGLALLLVPATLWLQGTRWHRLMGRVTAVDVIVGGITAVPVAWVAPVTKVSAAGFIAQGILWMVLLAVGLWNIWQGRPALHRRAMLLMAAVTTGAMFFRIYLALWAIFGWRSRLREETFYACDARLAQGLPLLLAGHLSPARGPTGELWQVPDFSITPDAASEPPKSRSTQ
ncbi:MAG: DUF2306 domain-containing protein [Hyphomicrobiales bacterium]